MFLNKMSVLLELFPLFFSFSFLFLLQFGQDHLYSSCECDVLLLCMLLALCMSEVCLPHLQLLYLLWLRFQVSLIAPSVWSTLHSTSSPHLLPSFLHLLTGRLQNIIPEVASFCSLSLTVFTHDLRAI